LKGRLLSCQSY